MNKLSNVLKINSGRGTAYLQLTDNQSSKILKREAK